MPVIKANYYTIRNTWFVAFWDAEGYDGCDELEAETADEACSECERLFPAATVTRVAS